MISIDSEQACLLDLIKISLFDMHSEISADVNWDKVFESAKTQCLVPLLASNVPEYYKEKWLEISYQRKAYFIQMIYEQNTLVNMLKHNNIHFVILKGTASAIYYPNPSLRTFGDIDFLVSEKDIEYVNGLLKKAGYIFLSNDTRHYEYERNGICFELHSSFSCDRYNNIDHIVLKGLNNAISYNICNYSFPGLPTYENGLVLLGHIMQHLKRSGIGLRQIIDWMLFVHNVLDDSTWEKSFKPIAVEAGLEKLAITVTFMCKKWLGLPNVISWCNSAEEEVADQLLIRLLDDGNLGHDRAPGESVKKSLKNEGVIEYLQRAGLENWQLARKYPFLRPFALIYQLFRYFFKLIVGVIFGRKMFMKNKHKMSLEELWKRLE